MRLRWIVGLALRVGVNGLIVALAFVVLVPDSFDLIQCLLTGSDTVTSKVEPVRALPEIEQPATTDVSTKVSINASPLPSVQVLFAEAERIHDLFDRGGMDEIYASFSEEAKAQVPENVFIAQATEVLEQLGPRKPNGWNDADWVSTWLNGQSKGRKLLLWKLHPDKLTFDVGSWRFGTLSEASEDLVLDVSGGQIKLAMFSEFKAQPPAASVWLPRTCPHPNEDALQHCSVPAAPANLEILVAPAR